jgi:hypothetical protein
VTKSFPATLAGVNRPLRISVRSEATVIGPRGKNSAIASTSVIGSSAAQVAGSGWCSTRARGCGRPVTAASP